MSSSSVRAAAAAAATSDDDVNDDASATAAVETTAIPATPAGPSANKDSDAPSSVSGAAAAAVSPSTPSSIGNDGHYAPFVVQIDPYDSVTALHDKIYDQTGLSVERQRLIYRGKIISTGSAANANGGGSVANINTTGGASTPLDGANNDSGNTNHTSMKDAGTKKRSGRVCDVAGLGDGHTIHLVPRPVASTSSTATSPFTSSRTRRAGGIVGSGGEEGAAAAAATSDALASAILGDGGTASDAGGAALLAALLGLGSLGSGIGTRRSRAEDEGPEDDDDLSLGAAALDEPGPDLVGSGIAQLLTGGTALTGTNPRVGRRARRAQNSASSATTPARPSHVLTTEVLEERQRQELGSLEPVRQGLLTTHTILHGAGLGPTSSLDIENLMPNSRGSSGLPPRRFFRGQWIDCLDTVNSWLEATVVDIASPEDVLGIRPAAMHPEHYNEEANPHRNRRGGARGVVRAREDEDGVQTRGDPIVGSTDWEGRRMLLLEPDPDAEDTEPTDRLFASEGQDLSNYRERPTNVANDVQLLLVHYNGWPRRWNEWIRSDSTRIRPFRSRTMHGSAVQQQSGRRQQRQHHARQERVGACPSIRAAFHASPSTQIVSLTGAIPNNAGDSDASERIAALSELRTVLHHVDALIESCVEEHQEKTNNEGIDANQGDVVLKSEEVDDEIEDERNSEDENFFGEEDSFLDVEAEEEGTRNLPWQATPVNIEPGDVHPTGAVSPSLAAVRSLDPAVRLRTLAPLLDRVGRVCVSISPHVTKLAESCSTQPRNTESDDVDTALFDNNIEDVSTRGEEYVASEDSSRHAVNDVEELNGLYDDEQEDLPGASTGNSAVGENDGSLTGNATTGLAPSISAIDWRNDEPDMVDFSNAAVHEAPTPETASPTRGARGRSIGGGGTSSSVSDNIASVILAAALAGSDNTGIGTGPRLVNLGGNRERVIGAGGGGGIDIHVHMLVTGTPGARTTTASTALGRAANTGGVTSSFLGEASTTSTPQQPQVPIAVPVDNEDDDLFSNLYTETPEPAIWPASPEFNHDDNDDSSSPPSTFADYEDEEEDDDIGVGVEDSGASLSSDELPVLSEIESDGEDNDDGVSATNEPVSPSTPTAGRDDTSSPIRSPSSPRRSPLSRLFRRSRRRR